MGLFDSIRQIKAATGEKDNDIIYKGSFYIVASFNKCVDHIKSFYQGVRDVKDLEQQETGDYYRLKQDWAGNIRIMEVRDEPQFGRCEITFDLNYPNKTHASKVFDLMKSQMIKFVKPEKREPIPVAATPTQSTTIQQPLSQADELAKWKKLKDDGVITEEEFQAKKKQILGL